MNLGATEPLRTFPSIVRSRVFSAPMAGYTDPPYRRLLNEFDHPVLFTEMIDSHALVHRNEKTDKMLGERHPQLFTQIAAGTPVLAEHAVDVLLNFNTAGLNINMGCPVKKVVSCGGGSNVLRSPSLVRDIVRAVRKKISIPLSVKFRSGWDSKLINYEEIARVFEGEGVDFIMLHARTRAEQFGGRAHWDHIARLKEVVKIPVVGNGDVISYESAKALFEQTNCDGIGIGRGAIGNPWVYLQADRAIRGLPPLPEPSLEERLSVIFRHYDYVIEYYGLALSSHIFRKHLVGYLKGLPGHKAIKEKLFLHEPLTAAKLREILSDYFDQLMHTPFAA